MRVIGGGGNGQVPQRSRHLVSGGSDTGGGGICHVRGGLRTGAVGQEPVADGRRLRRSRRRHVPAQRRRRRAGERRGDGGGEQVRRGGRRDRLEQRHRIPLVERPDA